MVDIKGCIRTVACAGYGLFCHLDFFGLTRGKHVDTPLIPTDAPTTSPIVPTIPPIAPTVQYTSLFVCINSSDNDPSERPPSQDPYDVTVARWRIRLGAPSSPPSSPIIQILPKPPSLPRRSAVLVLPNDTSQDNSSNSLSETSSDSHSNTSSDSSLRHSSSVYLILDSPCNLPTATFVGPSRKRCRSLTSSMPIASAVPGSLSPVRADLLLPRKRGTDVRVKVRTTAVEEADPSARGTIKIGVDRVTHHVVSDDTVESVTKDLLELVSADGSLEVIIMPTATRFEMTQDAINKLIAKCVEEALKAYDTARNLITEMEMKDDQQDDNVEANGDNGNGNDNVNGNPNVNNGGVVPIIRECTYQDFLECQPLNFKGTEGVVALTHWFEKMETVLHISNCLPRRQDAICIANNLMDQKLKGYVVKNAKNKRRLDNNPSDNRGQQQQPFKRMHYEGPCMEKCGNCKRVGQVTRDCRTTVTATP
uniref:Reverse transcriptase domain-containing protein n=1 Tax=Tanacetum cinerariifolium TaxID=118510 RepID=A0A699GFZ6_TANCI|nr:reverse transcriptase domain-containing protein [Tanacetum cinerariifolium]